jgi:acrylyl-CoA reductase (NADPH)
VSFRAIFATRADDGVVSASLQTLDDAVLSDGGVTVAIDWSTLNYKDAVALAGPQIIQTFPLVPGIDFAGSVVSSDDARFDKVVATGWGLSQTHHGGYAQRARVPGDWLVKLPTTLSTRDAMAIGTAGFTAMLSVLALEHAGVSPDRGDILVTGASGGVGSIAIALLAELGYRVVASTGKPGAADILDRTLLSAEGKPMGTERWAGAVDSVGGRTLANVLAQTEYRGTVTTCGFVGGVELPTTVLPFILRGVTLAGIDSVNAPQALRVEAWRRLAENLELAKLDTTVTEVGLADVFSAAAEMRQGRARGRTLVDVNR